MLADAGVDGGGAADGGRGGFVAISSRFVNNCALHSSGGAVCWGGAFQEGLVVEGPVDQAIVGYSQACFLRGSEIQCIDAEVDGPFPDVPVGEYTALNCGLNSSCGLRTDGTVVCWGFDTPQSLPPMNEHLTWLGPFYEDWACVLDEAAHASCWSPSDAWTVVPLPDDEYTWAVSDGWAQCGLNRAGEVRCGIGRCSPDRMTGEVQCTDRMGYDLDGHPFYWSERVGEPPPGPFTKITMLNLGLCGLRPNGDFVCWGRGYEQYLRAAEPTGVRFRDLETGGAHACGITLDHGEVLCWGTVEDPSQDWGQTRPPPWP